MKAIEIIQSLAEGIDPVSERTLPQGSPYHNPDIIIALHEAARTMEAAEKRRTKQRKLSPSRLNIDRYRDSKNHCIEKDQ